MKPALTTSLASLLPWWDPPARYAKQTHRRPHRCYPEKTRYPRVPRCRLGVVKTLAIVSGWEDFGFPSSQLKADLRTIQTTDLHGRLLRFPQKKSPIVLNQQERLAGPSLSIFENKTSHRHLSRVKTFPTKIFNNKKLVTAT